MLTVQESMHSTQEGSSYLKDTRRSWKHPGRSGLDCGGQDQSYIKVYTKAAALLKSWKPCPTPTRPNPKGSRTHIGDMYPNPYLRLIIQKPYRLGIWVLWALRAFKSLNPLILLTS